MHIYFFWESVNSDFHTFFLTYFKYGITSDEKETGIKVGLSDVVFSQLSH